MNPYCQVLGVGKRPKMEAVHCYHALAEASKLQAAYLSTCQTSKKGHKVEKKSESGMTPKIIHVV